MTCAQWMDLASLVSFLVWSSAALTAQGAPPLSGLTALHLLPGPASPGLWPPRLGGPQALAQDALHSC